jgi:asparagine synthase (glutamine-hydrolysing)
MCGIAGIAGPFPEGALSRVESALAHRGPDDRGDHVDPALGVALGMRRLSILDLEHGHQPMANEDGSLWIVFNGEIYNSPLLRRRLIDRGHRFATHHSDTEVLLHLYEEEGEEMTQALNGMFAFVLLDRRKRRLFGARDRLGIKPLYFWHAGGRFAFASELKALLALDGLARTLNLDALYHYFSLLYIPGDESVLEGIRRLPAATSFTYDLDAKTMASRRYWELPQRPTKGRSEDDWAAELRERLRDAVRRWSLSDVPMACSLSGGIDSSALVGLLSETGQTGLRTYSLGFPGDDEKPWDELELSRQVARRWATTHAEILLEPAELLEDLVEMVWSLDEPYAGGLPAWYVFREMGRDVKVGMTGSGGDELFGNYGKWTIYDENATARYALALKRVSPWLARAASRAAEPLAGLGRMMPPVRPWRRLKKELTRLPEALRYPFGRFYYASRIYLDEETKRAKVLAPPLGRGRSTYRFLERIYESVGSPPIVTGTAAVDFRTQLPEEFLFMTDRFSMAHRVEARVPYLDHELVEFVYSMPPRVRTRSRDLKWLFKRAVADLVPSALLTSPKRGFVIPVSVWLRRDLRGLVERLLAPHRLAAQGILNPAFHEEFVRPHLEGRADHTWRIWAALMFQLWHVVYIEERCVARPSFRWRDLA